MILCQEVDRINAATRFQELYPVPGECETYTSRSSNEIEQRFTAGKIRVLIVCGKLTEGFDLKSISVLGIFCAKDRNCSKPWFS